MKQRTRVVAQKPEAKVMRADGNKLKGRAHRSPCMRPAPRRSPPQPAGSPGPPWPPGPRHGLRGPFRPAGPSGGHGAGGGARGGPPQRRMLCAAPH
eukprot:scaffold89721_cov36-Prasinocladus_malaysianus.AAC.1